MSGPEDTLTALRAKRDAARADLLKRVETVKTLQNPKVLGQRIKADLEIYGRNALEQAMEIAADHRGIMAGTLTALGLWLARKQVMTKATEFAPKALPLLGKTKAWICGKWRKAQDESLG